MIHTVKQIIAVKITIKWINILKLYGTELSYFTCKILFSKLYNR